VALLANIRQGLSGTNTLAYLSLVSLTKKKSFPTSTTGYHRPQARVHLRGEVHPRPGQQQCSGHAQTDHRLPHRLQMAGKTHVFFQPSHGQTDISLGISRVKLLLQ
jgi:hypothetical protein